MRAVFAAAATSLFFLAFASQAAEPSASPVATTGKPSDVNAKGFPAPKMSGYDKLPWPDSGTTDASPAIDGQETMVETFKNKAGDKIMKLSTNGVVWAFGVLPGGDANKGYILRDPECSHKLTEKWAPDAPFSAPDCAVKAKAPAPKK
jgi:hypothetical protein